MNVVQEPDAVDVVQDKTGAKLWIPMHRDLSVILKAWPRQHVVVIATPLGKAYRADSFGRFMAKNIDAAGLPQRCVTHGLRKAAARRLAEAGCSSKEIASITGHSSLEEIERYTKAAEQKKLAKCAMRRLQKRRVNKNSQT